MFWRRSNSGRNICTKYSKIHPNSSNPLNSLISQEPVQSLEGTTPPERHGLMCESVLESDTVALTGPLEKFNAGAL